MEEQLSWIPATPDFIEADVIRWTEAIWSDKKRGRGRKAKHVRLGKQQVTGQIVLIDDDYVHVKVIESVMLECDGAKDTSLRKSGETVRKKPNTLVNGGLERLLWEDEETRASIVCENNNK